MSAVALTNLELISRVFQFIAITLGLALISWTAPVILKRRRLIGSAIPWFSGTETSIGWLRVYLQGLLGLVLTAGIIVCLSALAMILCVLLVDQSHWPKIIKSESGQEILLGAGAVALIVFGIIFYTEPLLRFNIFKYIFRRRESERRHAIRLKTETRGMFKIDKERCEQIARYIAQQLKQNPALLSSMLFSRKGRDAQTLANELIVGELFEALETEKTGYDWRGITGIQASVEGQLVCSPANLRQNTCGEISEVLATLIQANDGWEVSRRTKDAVADLVRTLKRSYDCDGLRLLGVPRITFRAFYKWFLREWVEWLRLRCHLINGFDLVQRRLKGLPVYQYRSRACLGLAKFAFEYDILDVKPEELELGKSPPIILVLLRTGAVLTDAKSLEGEDPDLDYFCDQALRCIATYLEGFLLKQQIFRQEELNGEHYPYNIVDGFLFSYAEELRRTNLDDENAPLLGIMESDRTYNFKYDRKASIYELE